MEAPAQKHNASPVGLLDIPPEARMPNIEVDGSSPSDEEAQDAADMDDDDVDARSLIGVSIGRRQTQLKSLKTPAVEKAAALDKVEGGGLFDNAVEVQDDTRFGDKVEEHELRIFQDDGAQEEKLEEDAPPSKQVEAQDDRTGTLRRSGHKPTQARIVPNRTSKPDGMRQAIRDGLGYNRKRSSSGPSVSQRFRDLFPQSMPTMPKTFSFAYAQAFDRHTHDASLPKRVPTGVESAQRSPLRQPPLRSGSDHNLRRCSRPSTTSQDLKPNLLRKSTSDNSLYLQKTLSRASSLGDDSRFENVKEMANNRMQALKDSWRDSNMRLSRPSFASFGPESSPTRQGADNADLSSANNGTRQPTCVSTKYPQHGHRMTSVFRTPQPTYPVGKHSTNPDTHPNFHKAIEGLIGDVVVLGGYRGSILRSAEPPHRQLWVPIKVGLNIRKVDLEVGLNPEDEERMDETIIPGGMLSHIGPVDISRRLFKRLRGSRNARTGKLRVWDYGYDWRLSPHLLSRKLIDFLKSLPSNQADVPAPERGATIIAHSLGGLITRHAVNKHPELFGGVVYAGVPTTCVNILGPLRNGDEVLLSSKVLTAQVNFTIRTSFALLPLEGRCFFNPETKEEYPVDFFDPQTWVDYRLSPCVGDVLPSMEAAQLGRIDSMISTVASVMPNISMPGRRPSLSRRNKEKSQVEADGRETSLVSDAGDAAQTVRKKTQDAFTVDNNRDIAPTTNAPPRPEHPNPSSTNPSTVVTLSRSKCIVYLERTLRETKQFKQELIHDPGLHDKNLYPPHALIYGKSTPTVYGAKVRSREAIKHIDAYDDLAFASGDGVVLARAAQMPQGYVVQNGGVVSSERGHVTLLGDLEAVGRCLNAVKRGRAKRVGLGTQEMSGSP